MWSGVVGCVMVLCRVVGPILCDVGFGGLCVMCCVWRVVWCVMQWFGVVWYSVV